MRYRKNQRKRAMIGFYVAMGVCLLAVGIAAVASYSGVKKVPAESSSASENHSENSEMMPIAEKKDTEESEEEALEESTESAPPASSAKEAALPEEETDEPVTVTVETEETVPVFQAPASYTRPVGGEMLKGFSGDDLVYAETMRDYRVHNGCDFAAAKGDAVNAIAEGVVLSITYEDLWGNVIVIDHYGYQTRYCGLGSTALVREGDTVKNGQPIGSVLDVPCEIIEPAHLHLEIKKDGENIDPMTLFS